MDYSAAQKRIDDLKSQINYHSNRYYNMDDPEISDYEYDMMMNELKQLEKEFLFPISWLETMRKVWLVSLKQSTF